MTPSRTLPAVLPNSSPRKAQGPSVSDRSGHNRHVLITSSVSIAALSGFVLGLTAGQLGEAFILASTGAVAVALVGAAVAAVKWLWKLDRKIERLDISLREVSLRVATVEHEFTSNDGSSTKDAITRIDRRSRKVAESVGAVDYDDEEAI